MSGLRTSIGSVECVSRSRLCAPLLLLLVGATAAGAQVPDSIPSFERPNGALMRTVSLTYALSLTRASGQVTPLGTRTVSVSDSPFAGAPAWLIADARHGTVVETTDSVWLARADLTPIRWASTIGRAQLGAAFARDSAFGAIDMYQGRGSFAVPAATNTLLSAGMVERVIELLPLRDGYRAAATLMLVDGTSPRVVAAELVVVQSSRIDVARRATDCWLVALRAGAIEQRLWVSKDGSRVVRTEQAVADGLLVAVLL